MVPGYEETIRWALTASWVVAQKVVAEQVESGEERRKELKGEKACLFRGV